ncbi:hypothetical protein FKP32DRAFT_1168772 [Trametes sanguinea]|nr:hypothetical protein FKP32DRAFT_1168772 [Trametes sanguinea]
MYVNARADPTSLQVWQEPNQQGSFFPSRTFMLTTRSQPVSWSCGCTCMTSSFLRPYISYARGGSSCLPPPRFPRHDVHGADPGKKVYASTHDDSKVEDIKKMGADHVVNTTHKEFHKEHARTLDILLSTLGDSTPLGDCLSMLYVYGRFITVGIANAETLFPLCMRSI